jgi:hypothetical protein
MCLLILTLILGPRAGIILWWLVNPDRWDRAFDTFIWPLLGFLFVPWTTLMFVAVAPTGNPVGWDWMWMGLAFLGDLFSYSGGYGGRRSVPGYPPAY